jgi:hypothetical protein
VQDGVAAVVLEGETLPCDLVGEARGAPMSKVGEAVRRAVGERLGAARSM